VIGKPYLLVFGCFVLLAACVPVAQPPLEPTLRGATPVADALTTEELCERLLTTGATTETRIELLETLLARGENCEPSLDITAQLYEAYLRVGNLAADADNDPAARTAYGTAITFAPAGDSRAADALAALREGPVTPTPAPDDCDDNFVSQSLADTPDYEPTSSEVRTLSELAPLRGVIYEPRDYPGRAFLAITPPEVFDVELGIIAEAGFNTVRVRLRYDALFHCPGDGAIPIADAITRLDSFLHAAQDHDLSVILVLNHSPDLSRYPLYDGPPHTQAQTAWLATRYADEPTVILWDVRERGDADYSDFGRARVVAWTAATVDLIRENAPQHPITATWGSQAVDVAPLLDVIALYHDADLDALRQRIAVVRATTDKPLLLGWVGYPIIAGDEIEQRDVLYNALQAAEANDLLGWAVYRAFDHPLTNCNGLECERYGLWNTSYFPKRALDAATATITGEIPAEEE